MTGMSYQRPELILRKISTDLIADIDNVLKCQEVPREIKNYYLTSIEPFLQKHSGILSLSSDKNKRTKDVKEILRGADFYCKKAREYFSFFGVNFEEPSKSRLIDVSNINAESIAHFLYSSVQLLYVILWEVSSEFLKPLEKLYYLRLCHSGLFPQKYPLFPDSSGTEKMELDFLSVVGRGALFRVNESLPFELRVVYHASAYFKECFEEGKKKTGVTQSEVFIDDFIRLFSVRNNVCHIGRFIPIQESSEERIQSLLYRLSTLLPRIQNSCLGIISVFGELARKEVEN